MSSPILFQPSGRVQVRDCLQFIFKNDFLNSSTGTSRFIVHTLSPNALIPLISQTRFSPSLTHLISHPPVLLTHLSTSYFTPPPPLSSPAKFWSVFTPISERLYESEKLVFGSEGEGHAGNDIVVEVIIRGGGGDGGGRKRGVEKVLEGWSIEEEEPCELSELESLKSVFTKKTVVEEVRFLSSLVFSGIYLLTAFLNLGCTRPNAKCILQPSSYSWTGTLASAGSVALCPWRWALFPMSLNT